MKVIYKYPLMVADVQEIMLPEHGDFLDVQCQHDKICMWAVVDTDEPLAKRTVYIVPTGGEFKLPAGVLYLGTVQMLRGTFVWHVFMEVK